VEIQHADGSPAIKLPSVNIGIDKLRPLARRAGPRHGVHRQTRPQREPAAGMVN
jgi:hypothetical protein